MKNLTTEQFTTKARAIHGNRYDYSSAVYEKSLVKLTIICPIHGPWLQRPNDHLQGCGCPHCKFEKIAAQKRSNVDKFATNANIIHHSTYNYSQVVYVNAITKVEIICNKHGSFSLTPDKHLGGTGCPVCSNTMSMGERHIFEFLTHNNIQFDREKRFHDLCGTTSNSRLRYDFFVPDLNLLIEYDGAHHNTPINVKGRLTPQQAINCHTRTALNDIRKNEYASANGYNLVRIAACTPTQIITRLEHIFKTLDPLASEK